MVLSEYGVTLRWRNVLLAVGIGGGIVKSNCNVCKLPYTLSNTGFLVWGLVYSVQAPFYTNEALKRGATLSQVENFYTTLLWEETTASIFSVRSGLRNPPTGCILDGICN